MARNQKSPEQKTLVLIQFRWFDSEDELDYLAAAHLTIAEIETVRQLLVRAENCNRIEKGWYLGPEGSPADSRDFIRELTQHLDLEFYEALGSGLEEPI